jgi:hypothetical protein
MLITMAAACGTVDPGHGVQSDAAPAASCSDGIQNGDETDVDCGGSCGACAADARCVEDRDCASSRCSASQCSASCELTGLVAYFPFDGDTLDHSPNQHDITASHVAATAGKFGGGYALDGMTSVMQVTGDGSFAGARTFCAWVQAMDVSDLGNPVFAGGVIGHGDFYTLEAATPSNPCGAPGEPFIDHWGTACMKSGMPVTSGQWSFVCFGYDGANVSFYRDGQSKTMPGLLFDYPIASLTVASTTIGGTTTHASMLGTIDEVTVWDHALGSDELASLYNHGRSCVP